MSKVRWDYIFGTVTITAIIGGTIYVIYKSKQADKLEEEAMTVEEAKELVKQHKKETQFDEGEETVIFESPIEEVPNSDSLYVGEEPRKRPSSTEVDDIEYDPGMEEFYNEEETDDPQYDKHERPTENYTVEPLNDFMYFEDGVDAKEDKTLRFDKNSIDAKHQFIRMELAEWESPTDDSYRILLQLMEVPFIPTNDGDEMLRTQIIDYKVQFFGFGSKWNREVSFGDVMLHYARLAEFNCGESVVYWIEYFLQFNDFYWDTTSQRMDMLVMRLNSHTYFNEERQTFGLFGLTRESMDSAIAQANRNLDRSVSYEIEFQEFLKSCL